ncbi:AAHS family benzoate transporter-like MFS transporter [Paraburkholderia sp. BL27I4N3]|uniref:MFS transporter n=1 Tax=Paraburkholderia sp. BL27I4N3 TaxID=1938805 RepID=UPI000E23E682|nr:MFS transporter [Paraburkholderia sp. BL27I4N3]REE07349.1 AAHS family benzoate transporter-like MFS transporter [Paraburkholderia sp. BL27I4N3]
MAALSDSSEPHSFDPPARTTYLVLLLCFLSIVAEGYDIGVMGTIVPSLLADQAWKLTPIEIGAMGSAALFGTLFGSYFISVVSDLVGRKLLLISCVALFSLSMLGAASSPTPFIFSVTRFVGGLGLGGVISAAAALTVEYSPPNKRNLNFALMYSGYSIGALLSAVIGMAFLGSHGWRFVVALGASPLIVVPFLMYLLPESLDFLMARGKTTRAKVLAGRLGINAALLDRAARRALPKPSVAAVFGEVFSRQNAWATISLWVAQVAAVMVIYGLGTWLPQLMRKLGYDLGPSLSFLAVFMLSSAIGGILIGRISDRLGARKTIVCGYVIGALAISGLAIKSSLLMNYVLVALAGFGSIGVAMVQLGFIANYYRSHARASATGWAVGIGRFGAMSGPMVGAYLAAQGADVKWNFFAFSAAALVAGAAIALTRSPEQTVTRANSVNVSLES